VSISVPGRTASSLGDHLNSIFAKTGARNRRTLLTRLAGQ
jgi:hypothetical protein